MISASAHTPSVIEAAANGTACIETLQEARGKQVWYSLSHGALEYATPDSDFQGLLFLNGEGVTVGDLTPLNLDYRLVLIDACSGAKTTSDTIEGARNNNSLAEEVMNFADAFGDHSAYVGWAWTMNPGVSQPLMAEFLSKLKYDNENKFTPSVAYAHAKFQQEKADTQNSEIIKAARLLKIYGAEALQNKIDLIGGKK